MNDIRVIREPKARVVVRQTIDEEKLREFLADEGAETWSTDTEIGAEKAVEIGGRICYSSYGKPRPGGNRAYTENLLRSGHTSVLEHAVWGIAVTGISRACSHELVRHRVGISPSQRSQRYVDEKDCAFVVPPSLLSEVSYAERLLERELAARNADAGDARAVRACTEELLACETLVFGRIGLLWLDSVRSAKERYGKLVELLVGRDCLELPTDRTQARKIVRQTARSILPEATETRIFLTCNARALRHAMLLRCSRHADAEIRRLFNVLHGILVAEAPHLFSDLRPTPLPDDTFALVVASPE